MLVKKLNWRTAMVDNRTAREVENRDTTKRKAAWTPPQLLPEPNPIPGWKFKYVRIAVMGQNDPTNTSAKFREGWEPVKAADHPEIMHMADRNSNSAFKDNIEIGGLLLCKAPEEMVRQRSEHFAKMNQAQMDGVDNSFLRQKDDRANMALFSEKKSTVSFGRGK
jgi:hypothetical protein